MAHSRHHYIHRPDSDEPSLSVFRHGQQRQYYSSGFIMRFSPPFALSSSSLIDNDDRRRFYMANNAVAPLSMSAGTSSISTHGSNASEIQHHLYSAFLEGRTSDVALHVRGSWEGIYRLHRVVLIQAVSNKIYLSSCSPWFLVSLACR